MTTHYEDLRGFVEALSEHGELHRVERASAESEIGVISELMYEREGPALLFDEIPGFEKGYRILANPFATKRRALLALGWPPDMGIDEAIERFKAFADSHRPIAPCEVRDGPVMANVLSGQDVDLSRFPAPRWHDRDGGCYLGTGDVVIMKDPDSGYINLGTYRLMVQNADTLNLYLEAEHDGAIILRKYWNQGKSAPVAVSLGHDPVLFLAASTVFRVGWGESEYGVAGYIRGEPVSVVVEKFTGLPIPANSEIVLVGESPPQELMDEGPFGEWTGYYAHGRSPEPIIRVKAIYFRDNPINLGCPPMRPRGPLTYSFGLSVQPLSHLRQLQKSGIPGILEIWRLSNPGMLVIKVKQESPGHARRIGHLAAAHEHMGRFIILVDEDVNIRDYQEVCWAVATRCEPATDTEVVGRCPSNLMDPRLPPDRRAAGDHTASFLIIDACRPYEWRDRFPPVVRSSDALREEVLKKWASIF